MFESFKRKKEINVTQIVNAIEDDVFTELKSFGFKKYGRTLHRFVSGDISQVIHFQTGLPSKGMGGLLCVNLGIRVPECSEREFETKNERKYYHEYECTIRTRLGTVSGKTETWYDLHKNIRKITASILTEIKKAVIPVFDLLNSREAILLHRRDYPFFDSFCDESLILLEESMIYGHQGNFTKAKEAFEAYYQSALDDYHNTVSYGHQLYLKKGERVVCMGQDITAEEDGYVTLYAANHGHLDYLNELAIKLGLR